MHLNKLPLIAAAATLVMLAGTAAASAASAYASTTVNVRAGAGSSYPVVDVLRAGEQVDVDYCRGAWCAVQKRGVDGWVNANYLSTGGRYNDDYDDRYDRYDGYDSGPDFVIVNPRPRYYQRHRWSPWESRACIGGSNASFCISN
jgi:uncharacterized protein YraI